tara:strand:- start:122 stop:265 length:144 start_codon:yes stop_codon:yes gene_type:complete
MNEKTEKPMMNNAQIKQIMHANDLAIAEVKRLREEVKQLRTQLEAYE